MAEVERREEFNGLVCLEWEGAAGEIDPFVRPVLREKEPPGTEWVVAGSIVG